MAKKLNQEDKKPAAEPMCSGRLGELTKEDLSMIKKIITSAMRYIKAYSGPSRTWFAYQDSLQEGCSRLSKIVSDLPVSLQTANLLISILLRLDNRLCRGGVDDSDGTVGEFIEKTVQILEEYAKLDNSCFEAFKSLKDKKTCFGWEESLIKLVA